MILTKYPLSSYFKAGDNSMRHMIPAFIRKRIIYRPGLWFGLIVYTTALLLPSGNSNAYFAAVACALFTGFLASWLDHDAELFSTLAAFAVIIALNNHFDAETSLDGGICCLCLLLTLCGTLDFLNWLIMGYKYLYEVTLPKFSANLAAKIKISLARRKTSPVEPATQIISREAR